MGMQSSKSSGSMSDINITPLVDVMLVLLIIFMVAAPVMEKERSKQALEENRDKQQRLVSLNLPALAKAEDVRSDIESLSLKVSDELIVRLGEKVISDCSEVLGSGDKGDWVGCFDNVERSIRQIEGVEEVSITIDASLRVPFGFVVGIMDRLYKSKIQKVSMFPRVSQENG